MKNGTMFGSLSLFNNKEFFHTNKTGTIFLINQTYTLEFFAYLVVSPDDDVIYDIPVNKKAKSFYLKHVKENARHYRDIGIDPEEDNIITLSTCSYEFDNARMVLLGKLCRIQ